MNIARLRWAVYNAGFGKSKVEGVASTVLTTAEHRASGSVSRRLEPPASPAMLRTAEGEGEWAQVGGSSYR